LGVLALMLAAAMLAAPAGGEGLKVNEPVSRDQAINIAYNVMVPATLDHSVTAFLGMMPLNAGDTLVPAFTEGRQYTFSGPTWFCWINDDSQSLFEHPTRYLFIDAATGSTSVVIERWWPVLNGIPLFMSDAELADPNLVIYSCIHRDEPEAAP